MVVASSNNGAVENVTLETPAADAIDPRWAGSVDHFGDIATRVLNGKRLDRPVKEWAPAWALLAAALGNAANRQRFVDAFWFELKPSNHRKETLPGLVDQLRSARPGATWRQARERFRAAEQRVADLAAERQRWYDQWRRVARLGREAEICAGAVRAAQARAGAAGEDLERLAAAFGQSTAARDRAVAEHQEWDGQRPNLLAALFRGWSTLRAWRERARALEQAMYEAIGAREDAEALLGDGERDVKEAQQALELARGLQVAAAKAFLECQSAVDATRGRLGRAFPDPSADRDVRELAGPWCDEAFNEARSELFLEALRLHKAFIEHNRARFQKGLGVVVDIIKRTAPDDLPHATRLAAWQLLFMAVPIISTTFASVARQFDGLGAEDLGWLLVDESGQATPQAAIGAIWRTKRTLAVGDPLQLEPILALPHTIEQALRRHHDVAAHWLPGCTSVQRLADSQTRYGTTLPGPDGTPLWIGSPLTVHRRCDEPMFTISNRIAYDGLMIADIHGREPLTLPTKPDIEVPPSMWLDVKGGTGHGHWRRGEGVRLDGLLSYLADGGFDMSEVMALTPFVEVARQLERRASTFGLGSTGTVHRAQGKQADIVIFVLGGDPDKPRAAQFAAEGPNLVNVAVSRAKRRLYVIGNHQTWSGLDYFADLASELGAPKPWKRETTQD